MERIGLIAGNGQLPFLFAREAKGRGLEVIAVAHRGETDPALEAEVAAFTWVRLGQVDRILGAFQKAGVTRAAMAGGIGRVRALKEAWPDLGAVRIISRLRSFRDDTLLRAIAGYFEEKGVTIVAPTDYLTQVLCPAGHLAGPKLHPAQEKDVALGVEVAALLGQADVGQTVVVKRCKPGQDLRFDLPAAGPRTLEVMREVGAKVLALEAGRTVLLEAPRLFQDAEAAGITVVGAP